MLIARNVTVTLGRRKVLGGVDFTAAPGEMVAIVGPNGSGKTTLMRALTGDVAAMGTVTLNGRDITAMSAWELAVLRGVLPQAAQLAFPFTLFELVQLGLTDRRATAGNADRLVAEALKRVGLRGYEGRFYQDLSGGEQQRAQLARVLLQVWEPVERGVPRWLFLDEPVSSLDIAHQLAVMRLARWFANAGGGVVAVMHDLNLSAMFCDRIAVMSSGQLVADGAPERVVTGEVLSSVYGCALQPNATPPEGQMFLLPQTAMTDTDCSR